MLRRKKKIDFYFSIIFLNIVEDGFVVLKKIINFFFIVELNKKVKNLLVMKRVSLDRLEGKDINGNFLVKDFISLEEGRRCRGF